MIRRCCERCGTELIGGRSDKRYCAVVCQRRAAYRPTGKPNRRRPKTRAHLEKPPGYYRFNFS